eukprot:1138865-Pelagomonas_calceolata.AAC.2
MLLVFPYGGQGSRHSRGQLLVPVVLGCSPPPRAIKSAVPCGQQSKLRNQSELMLDGAYVM